MKRNKTKIRKKIIAGLIALGISVSCFATVKPQEQVQAYSISKKHGALHFSNKYGTMDIYSIRVYKIHDDISEHPLQYTYFINGWFKNKETHRRSPISFYNRYFYDEEYYKGSYWTLDGGVGLFPSKFYSHLQSLAQRKIPKHAYTVFSLGASCIPPVKLHSNELFRISVTPYKSDYVAARQYFTTGYMHTVHFHGEDSDPNA